MLVIKRWALGSFCSLATLIACRRRRLSFASWLGSAGTPLARSVFECKNRAYRLIYSVVADRGCGAMEDNQVHFAIGLFG